LHPLESAAFPRRTPGTDSCTAATTSSFDLLVGDRERLRAYFEAERLDGLEVDHKLGFGGKRLALADLI
jgi:hypothetical protein